MEPHHVGMDPSFAAGAKKALADAAAKGEQEKAARKAAQKRGKHRPGDLNWFGLQPLAERGKYPRPAATYRGARRNAARIRGRSRA